MTQTTIQGGQGDLPVYLAAPPGPPPWPGVVVIHDALGMSQDARNQADWLASEGYLTAVPDLFSWGSTLACVRAAFGDMRRRRGRIIIRDRRQRLRPGVRHRQPEQPLAQRRQRPSDDQLYGPDHRSRDDDPADQPVGAVLDSRLRRQRFGVCWHRRDQTGAYR